MEWKKLWYWIPGVGLVNHAIKEYKTRKGKSPLYNLKESHDRKALGMYAIETGYLAFAIAWKVYVGNGIATGEWNPTHYFNSKDKIIENKEMNFKKQNALEKTIHYEKLLK